MNQSMNEFEKAILRLLEPVMAGLKAEKELCKTIEPPTGTAQERLYLRMMGNSVEVYDNLIVFRPIIAEINDEYHRPDPDFLDPRWLIVLEDLDKKGLIRYFGRTGYRIDECYPFVKV